MRPAKSGGVSKLMSAGALFNEILRRRPDLARVAQQPFHFDSRAQNPADVKVQSVPIFTWHAGHLNVLHKRGYIKTAQRFPEVPRLTGEQTEVLDMIEQRMGEIARHTAAAFGMECSFALVRKYFQHLPQLHHRLFLLKYLSLQFLFL